MNTKEIYFSGYFNISHDLLEDYGALDICIVTDNQAFIDPFLIFANEKYSDQHASIIKYLKFLKENATTSLDRGIYEHYFKFPEVSQLWLGFSSGNRGRGNGPKFGRSLNKNLNSIFSNFGEEQVTESPHLEKLCLIERGVGADMISDFTANLIKDFLISYTEEFARENIDDSKKKVFNIQKTVFDYSSRMWVSRTATLPFVLTPEGREEFVLLTPKDILAKSDTWISKNDFLSNDSSIINTISNEELRFKINHYFNSCLGVRIDKKTGKKVVDYRKESTKTALIQTAHKYPEIIDHYIRSKEDSKEDAITENSSLKEDSITLKTIAQSIRDTQSSFQKGRLSVIEDVLHRIAFHKNNLENNSNALYINGKPLLEPQMQQLFKQTTIDSIFDYNSEVNNGTGPIDFIASYGSGEKVGIELKMAKSSSLEPNLLKQGKAYAKASHLQSVIYIIYFFSDNELKKVEEILERNKLDDDPHIIKVDCRKKESASKRR